MKILIWTSSFYPALGGVQTVTKQLADGFSDQGHEVLVLTNRFPRKLLRNEIIGKYKVIRFIHWDYQPQKVFKLKNLLFNGLSVIFFPFQLINIRAIIRTFNPDVINIHFPHHQNRYALRIRKYFAKTRMIVSLHGNEVLNWFEKKHGFISDQIQSKSNLRIQFKYLNELLQVADGVTACSDWLANKASVIFPFNKATITIWNAVDLKAFNKISPKQNPVPYFFSFGRLEHKKGFDILIDAYYKLSLERNVLPKLIIAGSGIEEIALKLQADKLGMDSNVLFVGRLSQNEIIAYCKGSLANIIPSRIEPFGISVLEALASYRPFIGFNVGGISEICGNEIKLISPDASSLQNAMKSVLESDKFQLNQVKIESRLGDFSLDKMISKYLKMLQPN